MKILFINGPNLNLLGIREPELYGNRSYAELEAFIARKCRQKQAECEIFQSNYEGAIIDKIQSAYRVFDAIVINAAAYTHTSLAIADAICAVSIRTVEVHLTDTSVREEFRRVSYLTAVCEATFMGKGFESYGDAIDFICGKETV